MIRETGRVRERRGAFWSDDPRRVHPVKDDSATAAWYWYDTGTVESPFVEHRCDANILGFRLGLTDRGRTKAAEARSVELTVGQLVEGHAP
jgi:hypothetical protein